MNYFMGELSQQEVAEFKKQKQKRTLRDKILGTTNSGRAFRIGSAISLTGLGTLAGKRYLKEAIKGYKYGATPLNVQTGKLRSKTKTGLLYAKNQLKRDLSLKNLKNTFTKSAGTVSSPIIKKLDKNGGVIYQKVTQKQANGLFGTKRKLKWGNVAKTGAIAGTAVVIPVGASYVASNEEDRNKINKRLNQVSRIGSKVGKTVKSTINTLHKVSR